LPRSRFVSPVRQRWPERLWIVRHGQSAGNVARDAADAAGLGVIDLNIRDVDVPLSDLGHDQAAALGRWFAALPEAERPEVVLASPYVRARQTAKAICETGGVTQEARQPIVDERLREREFGLWDRLTMAGVREKFPDQAEQRTLLGKFYHRPPGGESWADVILRLRGALDTISLHHADRRSSCASATSSRRWTRRRSWRSTRPATSSIAAFSNMISSPTTPRPACRG
jgi:broad specificity phosphatase PhoE